MTAIPLASTSTTLKLSKKRINSCWSWSFMSTSGELFLANPWFAGLVHLQQCTGTSIMECNWAIRRSVFKRYYNFYHFIRSESHYELPYCQILETTIQFYHSVFYKLDETSFGVKLNLDTYYYYHPVQILFLPDLKHTCVYLCMNIIQQSRILPDWFEYVILFRIQNQVQYLYCTGYWIVC